MSDFGSPAARQRRLASELRRLRRAARLTGKEVAARLGWSEAKLSRIENGQTRVKIADLDEFMELYGISGPQRGELVALAEESRETGPVEELGGDLPEGYTEILRLESEAQAMSTWEPQVVPGLLQLEDYTRAVLLRLWPSVLARPAAEVDRRVQTSQLRQRVLTRDPPLELSFVIDESVLLRGFADKSVMHAQLLHLAQISERPNVELRILSLSKQVIGTGAFVCFTFPRVHGVSLPDTIALEHLHGTTLVDLEEDVNTYQVVFNALHDNSLNPQSSRDVLARVAREIWE